MSRLMSQTLLLSLIVLMAVVFTITRYHPDQEMFVSIAALVIMGLSLALEKIFPFHLKWNSGEGDTLGDVGSFVVVFGILDGALKLLTPFILLMLIGDLGTGLPIPLWLEIGLVVLLIELGTWLSHWMHHRYKWLWALHAMHHSTKRLYTMNNFRFHPLNHIINHLLILAPPLLLGFSPQSILGYVALSLPILMLQHSNVKFDFGRLNYIFNTNVLHRWHHSTSQNEGNKNLGRAITLWDLVFGTFYYPKDRKEPKEIGLFSSSKNYPPANRIWAQLLWPLNKECCRSS